MQVAPVGSEAEAVFQAVAAEVEAAGQLLAELVEPGVEEKLGFGVGEYA
jgi:hypothetical protein